MDKTIQTETLCAFCYYARMRTDICGIYCTGGFLAKDGKCDHFEDYDERRKRLRHERTRRKSQGKCGAAEGV